MSLDGLFKNGQVPVWAGIADTIPRSVVRNEKPAFDTVCWTEERDRQLRARCFDGWSASKIAKEFGDCSRNAVIGRIHRMGLRLTSHRVVPALGMRPSKVVDRPRRVKKKVVRPVPVMPKFKVEPLPPPTLEPVIPAALRVDLLGLKDHMCRFPIGDPRDEDFHFCARQKKRGVSYCEHHARLAFNPVQPRRIPREIP